MPHEITARMFLEDETGGLGASRLPIGAIVLNEGFDKPYWSWTNNRRAEIPSSSKTFALDGLIKILTDFTDFDPGEEYQSSRNAAKALAHRSELDLKAYEQVVMKALKRAPDHLHVSVMVYNDSTLKGQLGDFSLVPLRVRLFQESN